MVDLQINRFTTPTFPIIFLLRFGYCNLPAFHRKGFDRMDANKTETAASTRPRPQEPQAPPYVLHPRPFEPAPAASGETECLPIYTEYHDPNSPISTRELNIALFTENRARENDVNIWRTYINCHGPGKQTEEERAIAETQIITHYFSAIERGQEDVIALLVKSHFVTANTKKSGITPLLMAISRKNVKMVQLLLDLGADPNEFGSPPVSKCIILFWRELTTCSLGIGGQLRILRPRCGLLCSSLRPWAI
jgi:hypothetical protein